MLLRWVSFEDQPINCGYYVFPTTSSTRQAFDLVGVCQGESSRGEES